MNALTDVGRSLVGIILLLISVGLWLAWPPRSVQSALPVPAAVSAPAQSALPQLIVPALTATYTPQPSGTAAATTVTAQSALETRAPDNAISLATATPTRTPSPVNLGNFVWDDLDGDGRQDTGEPGLPGITVQLWTADKTQMLDQDITDGNGIYTVQAPQPMSVRVRVVLPTANDGFSPKDLAGGDDTDDSDINPIGPHLGYTDIINIASNVISITKIDAGIIVYRTPTPTRTPSPVNLGNFVWDDLDGDGQQDAGEPGLSGITVQLWTADKTQMLDQDITDANGIYTVQAPQPMSVRVRVVLPGVNDGFSPINQAGGDDTDDSDFNPVGAHLGYTDIINIASNVISITSIDAGIVVFRTPVAIGDRVWRDSDGDGVQDANERGIYSVRVQLWNSTHTRMIDETFTDFAGNYELIAPGVGSYYIFVELPNSQLWYTLQNSRFATEASDSDIVRSGPDTGFSDRLRISSLTQRIDNVDAGLTESLPLSVGTSAAPQIAPARGTLWLALAMLLMSVGLGLALRRRRF